jgi:hypothetical protein
MLLGTPLLSSAEEQEIKNAIRAQAKYAEHREAFEEIDQHLLTNKREGLTKDVTVLSLYNRCNQDIDAAKKVALRGKHPEIGDEQAAAPSLTFAYSSASKPVSPQSAPLESSQAKELDVRPIGSGATSQRAKKNGCCNLL